LNIYYFENKDEPKQKLLSHFQTKDLSWFWIAYKPLAIKASALLLSYLELNQKQTLTNLDTIWLYSTWEYLEIDHATIKNLDLLYNFSTASNESGTLFWILNATQTSAWKRFLRENILHPLKNQKAIEKRLDFVEEFLKNKILLDKVREKLSAIADIEAILNRISLERVSPRDLLNLKRSLESILEIIQIIQEQWSEKLKKIIWEFSL
jgi:DNA mismatch repair protein MutS